MPYREKIDLQDEVPLIDDYLAKLSRLSTVSEFSIQGKLCLLGSLFYVKHR